MHPYSTCYLTPTYSLRTFQRAAAEFRHLPWHLLGVGAGLAVLLAFLRVPVMSFAIGLYLPVGLNAMIFLGGMTRLLCGKRKGATEAALTRGTLFSAGLVAGEGVCGLLLAVAALTGIPLALPFGGGVAGGLAVAALILGAIAFMARGSAK